MAFYYQLKFQYFAFVLFCIERVIPVHPKHPQVLQNEQNNYMKHGCCSNFKMREGIQWDLQTNGHTWDSALCPLTLTYLGPPL